MAYRCDLRALPQQGVNGNHTSMPNDLDQYERLIIWGLLIIPEGQFATFVSFPPKHTSHTIPDLDF